MTTELLYSKHQMFSNDRKLLILDANTITKYNIVPSPKLATKKNNYACNNKITELKMHRELTTRFRSSALSNSQASQHTPLGHGCCIRLKPATHSSEGRGDSTLDSPRTLLRARLPASPRRCHAGKEGRTWEGCIRPAPQQLVVTRGRAQAPDTAWG